MSDIPTNVLALVTMVFGALAGAIGYVWKEKAGEKKALREECADLRKRIEQLQEEKLALLQLQLDAANKRRETDERLSGNLERLQDILKAKFAVT